MKYINFYLTTIVICFCLISCNNETEKVANFHINDYVNYIDSITQEDFSNIAKDWETIENKADRSRLNAQFALEKLKDSQELQTHLNNTIEKFDILKNKVLEEKQRLTAGNDENLLYTNLFGTQYVDDQLTLEWVNADNLLSVYQNLLYNCQQTKKHYNSRDFEYIKLAFAALNYKKNYLIKTGALSIEIDKIAVIERKFKELCDGTSITQP